jgi:hypothetical protein
LKDEVVVNRGLVTPIKSRKGRGKLPAGASTKFPGRFRLLLVPGAEALQLILNVLFQWRRLFHPEFVADAEAEEKEEYCAEDGLQGRKHLEPSERSIN